MSTADPIEQLMHDNLMAVFNERDGAKRQAAIQRTYHPDVRWTDAEGVITGHAALEAKCIGLQRSIGDLQFEPAGPPHKLPYFGYLAWRLVDPAQGREEMSGFDVAVANEGLITELWTVLIPPTP
ncbi:nuclear transport factor 2 family protein [Mycobacterium sp. MS1601]|uniref:nuclear transport factor 2 family protein n=1 Tax=Mycobacterium sp. MS1601 TaxID=1936029 RepID=UPI001F1C2790|nr:nuclear transport factor 2 family protein [Mycobacterium sp. MS1601]